MKQGTEVMPGGADTYHGYGRAWANVSNTPFREYKHWVHEGESVRLWWLIGPKGSLPNFEASLSINPLTSSI